MVCCAVLCCGVLYCAVLCGAVLLAEHTYRRNKKYIVLVAGNRRGNLLQLLDAGGRIMLRQI